MYRYYRDKRDPEIPSGIFANKDYRDTPAYKGRASKKMCYEDYVAASLREADMKVAEGTMKYYSADAIRSGLDAMNETAK